MNILNFVVNFFHLKTVFDIIINAINTLFFFSFLTKVFNDSGYLVLQKY